MKRALLAVLLLGIAMFAFGPTPSVDPSAPEARARYHPETPAAAAALVAEWSRAPGVTPGAEAHLVSTSTARAEWAVVYLHGFSATRQELAPYPALVAEGLNAPLFEARLTGHGQSGPDLADATAEAWVRDVREALAVGRALGKKLVVLACSTGATASALVAAHDHLGPDDVTAFVFLSPNFGPVDRMAELLLAPWAPQWVPLVTGAERSWEPQNEGQGRYWTTRYPVKALFPMMATVEAARSAPLRQAKVPLRVFFHPDDPVVSADATWKAFGRWGAAQKRMTPVEGDGDRHVLVGDILSPSRTSSVARATVDWVRSISSSI